MRDALEASLAVLRDALEPTLGTRHRGFSRSSVGSETFIPSMTVTSEIFNRFRNLQCEFRNLQLVRSEFFSR